jgi:hypothetical protein
MAKYRVFEKNMVTNEWIDRDWQEGSGQQDVIRKFGTAGNSYFVVPESSFHPVTIAVRETVVWQYENDTEAALAEVDG